jgi:hypothetical protein
MSTDVPTHPTALENYRRDGYTILRNVFNPKEIASLRDGCRDKGQTAFIGPRDFNGLLLSQKLIEPLRQLLGPLIVLFGDSSSRSDDKVADWSSRHFHVDARGDDFDYTRPYPLLRIGIYLQNHDVYSGGLKLRPGSWTRFCVEQYGMRRLIKLALRDRNLNQLKPPPGSINVDVRAGDIALWNLRMHHTGYAVRLRRSPQRSFHPFVENLIPRAFQCPEQNTRCAIFATYGAPSKYLDRYVENRWRIPELVENWKRSGACDPEVQRLAEARGLELRLTQS